MRQSQIRARFACFAIRLRRRTACPARARYRTGGRRRRPRFRRDWPGGRVSSLSRMARLSSSRLTTISAAARALGLNPWPAFPATTAPRHSESRGGWPSWVGRKDCRHRESGRATRSGFRIVVRWSTRRSRHRLRPWRKHGPGGRRAFRSTRRISGRHGTV